MNVIIEAINGRLHPRSFNDNRETPITLHVKPLSAGLFFPSLTRSGRLSATILCFLSLGAQVMMNVTSTHSFLHREVFFVNQLKARLFFSFYFYVIFGRWDRGTIMNIGERGWAE